jgi:hypothetical protein
MLAMTRRLSTQGKELKINKNYTLATSSTKFDQKKSKYKTRSFYRIFSKTLPASSKLSSSHHF